MASETEILNKVYDPNTGTLKISGGGGGGGGGSSTLQDAFDNGQSITIADTDNQTLAVTNNDTTNNPQTVFVDNNSNGISMKIDSAATTADVVSLLGNNTTGGRLLHVKNSAAHTGGDAMILAQQTSASSTRPAFWLQNAGTGNGLFIDQNGNGRSLYIDSESTTADVIRIDSATTSGRDIALISTTGKTGTSSTSGSLLLYNSSASSTGLLAQMRYVSASASGDVLKLATAGSGTALLLSAASGSHMNLAGDSANSSSVDGDFWFDGTNFKVNIAGTAYNIDVTAA